jgi:phosphosulfolactate phosphohydrolase-like enzyme
MPTLRLEWGIDGLRRAMGRDDNIVIIDVLRFSSAVVTATALGFTIIPNATSNRKTESATLSPGYFLGKKPGRVTIFSSNGAFLAVSGVKARHVIFGSLLNARCAAEHIGGLNGDTSLIAAGEISESRTLLLGNHEKGLASGNRIFCIEDMLGAGAISYFSHSHKSNECIKAEGLFTRRKKSLRAALANSASGKYDKLHGNAPDTLLCSGLNIYDVVPELGRANGTPLIHAAKENACGK